MLRRIIALIALSLMLAAGVTALMAVNSMEASAGTSFSQFGCQDLKNCGGALHCSGYGTANGCHIDCDDGFEFDCLMF